MLASGWSTSAKHPRVSLGSLISQHSARPPLSLIDTELPFSVSIKDSFNLVPYTVTFPSPLSKERAIRRRAITLRPGSRFHFNTLFSSSSSHQDSHRQPPSLSCGYLSLYLEVHNVSRRQHSHQGNSYKTTEAQLNCDRLFALRDDVLSSTSSFIERN